MRAGCQALLERGALIWEPWRSTYVAGGCAQVRRPRDDREPHIPDLVVQGAALELYKRGMERVLADEHRW